MDAQRFELGLKADGYTEIETKSFEPRPANGEHGHHFSVRGLVLDGAFTVLRGDTAKTFGPGEIFAVPEGEMHCEAIGARGARVLVGRRY